MGKGGKGGTVKAWFVKLTFTGKLLANLSQSENIKFLRIPFPENSQTNKWVFQRLADNRCALGGHIFRANLMQNLGWPNDVVLAHTNGLISEEMVEWQKELLFPEWVPLEGDLEYVTVRDNTYEAIGAGTAAFVFLSSVPEEQLERAFNKGLTNGVGGRRKNYYGAFSAFLTETGRDTFPAGTAAPKALKQIGLEISRKKLVKVTK
jgi:hypothetical protein